MHYKIVTVNNQCPELPGMYLGEFQPVAGEHPLLTALVCEFGEKGKPAVECLHDWSGGEVKHWASDLEPYPEETSFEFEPDDTHFYVEVGEEPFRDLRNTPLGT